MRRALLLLCPLLTACADERGVARGPIAAEGARAALASGAPVDLVLAIAIVERGVRLPERRVVRDDVDVPAAGLLELRHGAFDSLARGAALMGTSERRLREERALGTEAGARVLAELGRATGARADDLWSWRAAVATLSGIQGPLGEEYVHDVFSLLRRGADVPAQGETIHVAAHPEIPDVPPPLRQASGTPDFPGAIWVDTSCTNKCDTNRPDGNASVNTVVVHDTEGGWSASLATLQKDSGKSAHYLIDADGSRVAQFIPETYTGWHAGNYCYNKHSIGIEHVGFVADNTFQTALYRKSVELVKSIRTRWSVPLDRQHIIGHYQVPNGSKIAQCSAPCADRTASCITNLSYGGASHHTDPGAGWEWCLYMRMLGGSCTCADAFNLWNCSDDKSIAVRCSGGDCAAASCAPEIEECSPCESQPLGVNDICHKPADMSAAPVDMTAPGPDLAATTPDLALLPDLAPPADGPGHDLSSPGNPDAPAPGDGLPARTDGQALDLSGTRGVEGGCQCRTGGRASPTGPLLALGLAALLGLLRRRR